MIPQREIEDKVYLMTQHIKNRKSKKSRVVRGNEMIKEDLENSPNSSKVKPPVQAKNGFQRELFKALKEKQVIVVDAPAGVGKSYCIMSQVMDWYVGGQIDDIKIARPAVGMGNTLGLLKGDLRSKYEPFLLPLISVIKERYGIGVYETALKNENLQLLPVEYLRGLNFSGVAICEESQNLQPHEAYSILTRVTEYGKLIIMGDHTQKDIKGKSGLEWIVEFIDKHKLHEFATVVRATSEDIVRGGFCKAVVQAKESTFDPLIDIV